MTVEQLIEKLEELPKDYDIAIYNEFEGGRSYYFEIDIYDELKVIELSC